MLPEKVKELTQEIHEDKQIDPDALDVAWIEQSDLYYKYSDALNEALQWKNDCKLKVEQAKDHLENVKASLDIDIRKNPDSYDLPKITEQVVNSAIILEKDYGNALNELYEAKEELNEAQDFVNKLYSCTMTMEQRKTALEQLVRLLNQQYFSTPSEPRDLSKEYKDKINENRKGAKEKVKRRNKK